MKSQQWLKAKCIKFLQDWENPKLSDEDMFKEYSFKNKDDMFIVYKFLGQGQVNTERNRAKAKIEEVLE
jgi:hypothetical protein